MLAAGRQTAGRLACVPANLGVMILYHLKKGQFPAFPFCWPPVPGSQFAANTPRREPPDGEADVSRLQQGVAGEGGAGGSLRWAGPEGWSWVKWGQVGESETCQA